MPGKESGKEPGRDAGQDQFKLVYAGEISDGQHAAVVKKRLAGVLKLDDERMDVLFSGKAVVVKKSTDARTAARYQEVFKKAGARLRVQPVEGAAPQGGAATPAPAPEPDPPQAAAARAETPASDTASAGSADGNLQVMPVGSDVLTDAERPDAPMAEVDTSHLSVQGAVFVTDEPEAEVDAPNVDHLSVAEPGTVLGEPTEEITVEIDADFDLADVGTDMGEMVRESAAPIDVDAVDFEVADAGADLDTKSKQAPPAAPDTSHLKLDDD